VWLLSRGILVFLFFRWTDAGAESPAGLTFQAFIEAFMNIAKRSKLRSSDTHEMVDNLLHYCEANLEYNSRQKLRRAKLPKIPVRYTQRAQQSAKVTSQPSGE